MANAQNLTPWRPGESGNPAGKPKGTKHLSTYIREMLEDETCKLDLEDGRTHNGAPMKAVLSILVVKAIKGDMKAFDLLAKYGYGTKLDVTSRDEPLANPLLASLSNEQLDDKINNVLKATELGAV